MHGCLGKGHALGGVSVPQYPSLCSDDGRRVTRRPDDAIDGAHPILRAAVPITAVIVRSTYLPCDLPPTPAQQMGVSSVSVAWGYSAKAGGGDGRERNDG